jgi:hypothetical protein
MDFPSFKKIPRLNREIVVTEKLDGTSALVSISEDGSIKAGSRNRWITPTDDNYGFAKWVERNKEELLKLGVGNHHGEWWGAGIQRRYDMKEKVFSLFNTGKWNKENVPSCCRVVPVIYQGLFSQHEILIAINTLTNQGSMAAEGFMNPEGICIYHTAADQYFKVTVLNDEKPKGLV